MSGLRFTVDGTTADGSLMGGVATGPFWVHDCDRQDWVAGPFATWTAASSVAQALTLKEWRKAHRDSLNRALKST
jgi:hypothetical protein